MAASAAARADDALTSGAPAQSDTVGGEITVMGKRPQDSAVYQAPTKAPLDAVEPVSVIDRQFIEKNIMPTQNWDKIVALSPGVSISAFDGGDGKVYVRGFNQTQHNFTFDGIPVQLYNNRASTRQFFMTNDIERVSVDRGPGTAATVGDATFGGTIASYSRPVRDDFSLVPSLSYGSFDTQLYSVALNSGKVEELADSSVYLAAHYKVGDGYFTNVGQRRTNVFLKSVTPVGERAELTFVGMYNELDSANFAGASKAQIAEFGADYGLSRDPTKQNYYRYNTLSVRNDFAYIGYRTEIGDAWTLSNKLYTFSQITNPQFDGGDISNRTPNGTVYGPNNVPGTKFTQFLRAYGDVFDARRTAAWGALQVGVWVTKQSDYENLHQTSVDLTLNGAPTPGPTFKPPGDARRQLEIVQPYLQADLTLMPRLTLSPGIKYEYVRRGIDARQDPTNGGRPADLNVSWSQALPSIVANYRLNDYWAVYAQAAQGFLSPPYAEAGSAEVDPQTTWNYQAGTSWQSERWALSGNVYYIDFDNLINSRTVGGVLEYYNAGGATYQGMEAEGTLTIAGGFSLYANGSVNIARDKLTDKWIPEAPKYTAAAGVIYDRDNLYVSLLDKWIDDRFGAGGEKQPLEAYNQLDFSFGYTFMELGGLRGLSLKLNVENLLDSRKIVDYAGTSGGSGTPLYNTQTGRNVFVTVSTPFGAR